MLSFSYRSQRVLQLRISCQVADGGGIRSPNGEVVGDRNTGGSAKKNISIDITQPNSFGQILLSLRGHGKMSLGLPWGYPPALQLFCGFAPLWYCFLSVKSHNNGQQLGLGVLFHLH